MNSRQLQYAIMLSKTRNFSQVAEELDIAQPTLSKQIINLENDLGVKLFDRSTTPLTLTPAGEYFVGKAQELLFEEEVLLKTMERYRIGEMGKLTIGISAFRSMYMIPPVVKGLRKRYPDLQVAVREYDRAQRHKALEEGLYDFIITNLPVDEDNLEAIPLEKDRLTLAVPVGLAPLIDLPQAELERALQAGARGGKLPKLELSRCERLPFVVTSKGQEMRTLFDRLCRQSLLQPRIYVEVVFVTTAWKMVQSGDAAALLPLQYVLSERPGSEIALFEIESSDFVRQPAVVTRRGQFISEYARHAIELFRRGGEAD